VATRHDPRIDLEEFDGDEVLHALGEVARDDGRPDMTRA
jgi:hypothetical protein